jgi:signal transduction histidine kinase
LSTNTIAIIYFFYGLAFFSMGLAVTLEYGKCSDARLRHALRPLAAFGFIHGMHEWIEMFILLGMFTVEENNLLLLESLRIGLLAFSFLSLAAFGSSLLAPDEQMRRISLLLPLSLSAIWAFGLLIMRGQYSGLTLFNVADVWTRYILAVPAALFACAGLVVQQRRFRQAGLAQFGQDSLWAAIAFFWYGVIGQTFTRISPLPPSNVINQVLFAEIFGFPVQLLRAAAAMAAAVFVIRFLRAFEVETQEQIAALQASRLEEAQRREAQRGELLRRVVQAQEAERQRIGRELHDETGQSLTAIGLGLRGVTTTLFHDQEKAASNLKQLQSLVAHSMTELQRLIADLRPSHLDDLGLPAAFRWYAGEVEKRTGLKVTVEVNGEQRDMPSEVKTALFRVVQEALNNTIKYAYAQNVSVKLTYSNQDISVVVKDDGRGFDVNRQAISSRPTWGLIGMRERASLLGGHLEIQSDIGRGTQVLVEIPYQLPEEEEHDTRNAGG